MMGLNTRQTALVVLVTLIAAVTAGTGNMAYIAGRATMAAVITVALIRTYSSDDRGATTT